MGNSVRYGSDQVWVRSCSGQVTFEVALVWVRYGSVRVDFESSNFLVKYTRYAKISNFVANFGSSMIRFGLIQVLCPLSEEHILGVGSGMGSSRSVRILISGQVCQVYSTPPPSICCN